MFWQHRDDGRRRRQPDHRRGAFKWQKEDAHGDVVAVGAFLVPRARRLEHEGLRSERRVGAVPVAEREYLLIREIFPQPITRNHEHLVFLAQWDAHGTWHGADADGLHLAVADGARDREADRRVRRGVHSRNYLPRQLAWMH